MAGLRGENALGCPRGLDAREIRCRRNQVVAEVRRAEVAVLVVHDLLVEHGGDALCRTALLLPVHERAVDHDPAIIDRDEAHQLECAGLAIEGDRGRVHTERDRRAGLGPVVLVGDRPGRAEDVGPGDGG